MLDNERKVLGLRWHKPVKYCIVDEFMQGWQTKYINKCTWMLLQHHAYTVHIAISTKVYVAASPAVCGSARRYFNILGGRAHACSQSLQLWNNYITFATRICVCMRWLRRNKINASLSDSLQKYFTVDAPGATMNFLFDAMWNTYSSRKQFLFSGPKFRLFDRTPRASLAIRIRACMVLL